jgi:hypothetical protein
MWYKTSEGRYGARGRKGDLGEQIVKEYCHQKNIAYSPRNDYVSQVKHRIDCLINAMPVDVKANYFKGTLCVELHLKKKPGWIFTTRAVYIYGVDVDSKSIYRYNVDDMRKYVCQNRTKAKKTKNGDVVMWIPVETPFIERLQ